MFYMALSLSFTAGGIILLYLLWHVVPVEGQTLNAVTFRAILASTGWQSPIVQDSLLWVVLALEGGLLLVAANTGFLGGPAVLANMAADSWVPHQYRYLSTRLVTQRGIQLMGLAAFGILVVTGGRVALLVVLYSINVFLTFSLSLLVMIMKLHHCIADGIATMHMLAGLSDSGDGDTYATEIRAAKAPAQRAFRLPQLSADPRQWVGGMWHTSTALVERRKTCLGGNSRDPRWLVASGTDVVGGPCHGVAPLCGCRGVAGRGGAGVPRVRCDDQRCRVGGDHRCISQPADRSW